MKKFVLKAVLFFVLIGGIIGGLSLFTLFIAAPQYSNSFNAAIIDKIDTLKKTESPKIILVGNSSLAFGIDSPRMEEALGMPVINTGLYGALNDEFAENVAKENIGEGDIVVVAHTDYQNDEIITNPGMAWITIENHFDLWHLIDAKNIEPMLKALPKYILKCIRLWVFHSGNLDSGDAYSRLQFNANGDDIFDRPKTELSEDFFAAAIFPGIDEEAVSRLNVLNDYCKERGATLVIAAMPIAQGKYTASKEAYEAFEKELAEKLDAPVISHFTDYMIPYGYFFDTEYHLTNDGVRIRTDLLIGDLKAFLKE